MSARVEALIQDVKEERKITAKVIRGIYEVGLHKDYLAYNCDSLFQFCVIVLGYEGGVAYRRIEAAKLLEKAPEIAEQIESGALSLTNVATVSRIQEKARRNNIEIPTEKLIAAVTNTETRVAERKCLDLALEYGVDVDPEKRRYDSEVDDLLSTLSHKHPGINREALLRMAIHEMHGRYCTKKSADQNIKVKDSASSYVPVKLREAVRQRNQHRCSHQDPRTGKICESRHQLEIDHILPRALGGKTELRNLRLLCRFHNQQAARALGLRRPVEPSSARNWSGGLPGVSAPHFLPSSA